MGAQPPSRGPLWSPRRWSSALLRRGRTFAGALAQSRAAVAAARQAERRNWLRRLALSDPGAARGALRRGGRGLTAGFPPRFRAEAEALLTARIEGYAAAGPAFAALAGQPQPAAPGPRAFALLRPNLPTPGVALATPRSRAGRPRTGAAPFAGIVLYTARFGAGPVPAPLLQALPGLRALLLTDRPLRVEGWETVVMPAPDPDPDRARLLACLRGEEILAGIAPDTRASLWIDPGMRVIGNLATLLERWLLPQEIALWRHGTARDWAEVTETALTGITPPAFAPPLSVPLSVPPPATVPALSPAAAGRLLALTDAAIAAGMPRGTGAGDARALWRRHGSAGVAALMAAWQEGAGASPESAETLLALLLAEVHRAELDRAEIHQPEIHQAETPGPGEPAAASTSPAAGWAVPRILPPAPAAAPDGLFLAAAPWPRPKRRADPPAGRPLRIAFLYDEAFAGSASTFLRAGQLADLVAEELPGAYDIAWTTDVAGTRDSLVILTKWALQTRSPEEIAAIRARNLAVVGVWDDLIPDAGRMAVLDASMSLSHAQTLELARTHPGTPAFYVPHHVNRLIRPSVPPVDRLRTGYFGELANTVRPPALGGLVELVGINTSRRDEGWITRLPEFNAHWIIRQRRDIDGAKPFLKGFLAARCGAVVVTAREDDDALLYLGDDYPFFVRSLETADLEAMILAMVEGFGGPDWRLAQAIMADVGARSSDRVVAAEFRAMVETITG